jgi:serine protease Do
MKMIAKLSYLAITLIFLYSQLVQANDVTKSRKNAITEAIKKASPAIVGINITETKKIAYRDPFDMFSDPFFSQFFNNFPRQNRTRDYEVKGLGSGFIISDDGYILTNHHVAGNASKIVITLTDGTQHNAKIIGSDATSDISLLKIDTDKDLPYLEFGNTDDLLIGEWAIAFGNPFGLFDVNSKPTVTVGVISNTGVNFLHQEQGFSRVYRDMIQTDAAISSGNSGGPLVNALGQVIGINTVIYSTAQSGQGAGSIGIGYSIPINRVKRIVELLKEHKEIKRDFVTGIEVKELDENLSKNLGIKQSRGVVIYSIVRGSAGDDIGLEPGDVIIEADGLKILRDEDLLVVIKDACTGQTINLKIQRGEETINKKLYLKPPKSKQQ